MIYRIALLGLATTPCRDVDYSGPLRVALHAPLLYFYHNGYEELVKGFMQSSRKNPTGCPTPSPAFGGTLPHPTMSQVIQITILVALALVTTAAAPVAAPVAVLARNVGRASLRWWRPARNATLAWQYQLSDSGPASIAIVPGVEVYFVDLDTASGGGAARLRRLVPGVKVRAVPYVLHGPFVVERICGCCFNVFYAAGCLLF